LLADVWGDAVIRQFRQSLINAIFPENSPIDGAGELRINFLSIPEIIHFGRNSHLEIIDRGTICTKYPDRRRTDRLTETLSQSDIWMGPREMVVIP
jgi:hypothetical protein